MVVLGTISGSSLDGLDVALCRIEHEGDQFSWELLAGDTIPFPDELVAKLALGERMNVNELCITEVAFSRFCGQAIHDFLKRNNARADYVSSHGHTITHHPELGYTLQIGDGAIMAEMTGLPTVVDSRANDVARGGQGAPIAPIVEQHLLAGHRYYLNLGGIANISEHTTGQITSYDVCPCNQILNAEAKRLGMAYDAGGEVARSGSVHHEAIKALGQLDYFHQPAPKSLDNKWVMTAFYDVLREYELTPADALATMVECATDHIADSVSDAHDGPVTLLATGGGAHNVYFIERLQSKIKAKNVEVVVPDADIIDYKEAILMSLMGYLRVNNMPNTIPTVTGADRATSGGAIYVPRV